VRHDYYQLLLEQFIDRWARPYYEYCERNGIEFTGHYWEHEWPGSASVPDNMAMSAWQQRPGIDTLMNQYRETRTRSSATCAPSRRCRASPTSSAGPHAVGGLRRRRVDLRFET